VRQLHAPSRHCGAIAVPCTRDRCFNTWDGIARVGCCPSLIPSPPARSIVLICTKCGNRNQDTEQFCSSCNAYLPFFSEKVADPTTGQPATPDPAPPTTQPPPPPPPPRPVTDSSRPDTGRSGGDGRTSSSGGWQPPTNQT